MQDAITRSYCSSSVLLIFPYRGSLKNAECPCDLQSECYTPAWPRQIVRLRSRGAIVRIIMAIAPFVCPMAASTAFELSAPAQTATRYETIDRFAGPIAEASTRFAVPASWIRAVMQVESGGDEHATSPRGAMGLMQLMPGTWVELSVRYGLGLGPFDPSDNILAGTAYLKEMHARFGSPGFLAAYHAGPARYEQHLATGKSLPQETMAYVAAVTSVLAEEQGELTAVRTRRAVPWREAPLFIDRADACN
jgi:soluble lytic murein transglycosylase-like protein